MFRFLTSKKGFSLVEIFIVVIILGILTAVGVPVFGAGIKKQRQNECSNQRIIIATAVQQVMYGMVDNGKKQSTVKDADNNVIRYALDFTNVTHKVTYEGHESFKLTYTNPFTIGEIRGGYRAAGVEDYKDGCEAGNYLKKQSLKDTPFYTVLDNQEIPVCPFADYDDTDTTNDYYYYIYWDQTNDALEVVCSCPDCNEAD